MIDKDRNEGLGFGSKEYMKKSAETACQIARVLGIRQTPEQYAYVSTLPKQQLYNVLMNFAEENMDQVLYLS